MVEEMDTPEDFMEAWRVWQVGQGPVLGLLWQVDAPLSYEAWRVWQVALGRGGRGGAGGTIPVVEAGRVRWQQGQCHGLGPVCQVGWGCAPWLCPFSMRPGGSGKWVHWCGLLLN